MSIRPLLLLLLPVIAGCANEAESDEAAGSADSVPTSAVVAPQPDTLESSVNMRCDNGTEVRANVYVGSEPRLVLATHDTGVVLHPRAAASGSRYGTADESIVWWSKGDSATLTFRGTSVACGPADDVVF